MSHWRPFPVKFATAWVGQIQSLTIMDGKQQIAVYADGYVDPYHHIVTTIMPGLSLTSHDIEQVFAVAKFDGADVTTVLAHNAKIIAGGARSSSADNNSYTLYTAFCYPTRLSINSGGQDSRAVIGMNVAGYKSDGSSPMTIANNASLPTPTVNLDHAWTQGPLLLNGVAVTGFQTVEVDFGIQVVPFMVDGNLSPKYFTVIKRQPVIRITAVDLAIISSLTTGNSTLDLDGTDGFELYLRKYDEANGGAFVADDSAEHIYIKAASGIAQLTQTSSDPTTATIEIRPHATTVGTDCLAISTAVELP